MYKVGITGGIGSGKSTVCNMLREMGVPVYDSDIRAKALMSQSEDLRQQLVAAFGEECYNAEGLDKGYLAQRVFGDKETLHRLNAIVHPAVRQDFRVWAEQQSAAYVVLESAILFEAAFDDEVDTTLAVLAPRELRVERTMQRDGVSREEVLRRMEHQAGDDFLHARAKRTLVNLNKEYLASDVEQLHKMLVYESQK